MEDGKSGGYLNMFRGMISVKSTENFQQPSPGTVDTTSENKLAVFNFADSNDGWPTSSDDFYISPLTGMSAGSRTIEGNVSTYRRGSLGSILFPRALTESITSNINSSDDKEQIPTSHTLQLRRSSLQIDLSSHVPDKQDEKKLLSPKEDLNNNSINKWSLFRRNTMTALDGIPENDNQLTSTTDMTKSQSATKTVESNNNSITALDHRKSLPVEDRRNSAPADDLSSALKKFEGKSKVEGIKSATDMVSLETKASKTPVFNFSGAISRRLFQVPEKSRGRNKDINMVAPTSW